MTSTRKISPNSKPNLSTGPHSFQAYLEIQPQSDKIVADCHMACQIHHSSFHTHKSLRDNNCAACDDQICLAYWAGLLWTKQRVVKFLQRGLKTIFDTCALPRKIHSVCEFSAIFFFTEIHRKPKFYKIQTVSSIGVRMLAILQDILQLLFAVFLDAG